MKEVPNDPPSAQELKDAAEFRAGIHQEALERLHSIRPGIRSVKDPYPLESYFEWNWEYPGAWYRYVSIPEGFRSRKAFVDYLVQLTLDETTQKASCWRDSVVL